MALEVMTERRFDPTGMPAGFPNIAAYIRHATKPGVLWSLRPECTPRHRLVLQLTALPLCLATFATYLLG